MKNLFATFGVLAIVALILGATVMSEVGQTRPRTYDFGDISVNSTGFTAVSDEIVVFPAGREIGVSVCNTGDTNALDDFKIVRKIHANQSSGDVWLTTTDFDSTSSVLQDVSAYWSARDGR